MSMVKASGSFSGVQIVTLNPKPKLEWLQARWGGINLKGKRGVGSSKVRG